jgi:hypothetical protein
MNETNTMQHQHVAWKDRIGLSDRWEDAIKGCYYNWDTDAFFTNLDALLHMLVNIRKGVQLYNLAQKEKDNFKKKEDRYLSNWIAENPERADNPSRIKDFRHEIKKDHGKKLFHFIVQMLEDNGFGFYKSEYDGEYDIIK